MRDSPPDDRLGSSTASLSPQVGNKLRAQERASASCRAQSFSAQ